MWLIVLLWILIILWKMKYRADGQQEPFSKQNTEVLKGICALEIVLGHLGIATESVFLFPNRKAGILFVGIFFALSGYGLAYSVVNKQEYLNGFLLKRLPKILIPAYMIYGIGVVIKALLSSNGLGQLGKLIDFSQIFGGINWYIWELALFYIVFYLCAKTGSLKRAHWYILVFSVGFILVAFALGADNPWYGSTLCFWLGIVYFLYQDRFKELLVQRHMVVNLTLCVVIVGGAIVSFFALGTSSFIGNVIGRNLASFFFVICVIILLYRFEIGNAVSIFLGKYSLEIFLIHPIAISICRRYVENDLIFAAVVILVSVLGAVGYRKGAEFLRRLVSK